MNRTRPCLFVATVGAALVVACSSSPTRSTGTQALDAATTVTKDANEDTMANTDTSMRVDANVRADTSAAFPEDAASGVTCENVSDCNSTGVCCVRVDVGPAQPGKSFPQCNGVTGAAVCETTVVKCKYVKPGSCNARIVSHACNSTANCTEPGVAECCDVSSVFAVPTGSRVCLDETTAGLLNAQMPGSCL